MNTLKDELYNLDQQIHYSIEVYGWHVIKVLEDETGPSFGYSIRLFKSFNHPEIIIIGPEVHVIHNMINKLGEAIIKGASFYAEPFFSYPLEDMFLYFTPIDKSSYGEYMEYAQRFYHGQDFPVLQCLYPAPNSMYR